MLQLVPTVRTTYSQTDFIKAVIEGWREMFNETPSKQSVGIIFSQHMIETGGTAFWDNNVANIKVGTDDPTKTITYYMLANTWEIVNGKKKVFQPPDRQTWFRAFPTLLDGMKFHLDLLKNKRYKSSWSAVEQGSVVNFATLLKDHGYYTAPLQSYIDGMNRFYQPYMKGTAYEQALSELDTTTPPLQPWVQIPDTEPMVGELQIMPSLSEESAVDQGIDDAEQVDQGEIEQKGGSFIQKVVSFFSEWLPKQK